MKIKKIKKLNNAKYQIELENGEKIITYDDVIIKNNILYKTELTSDDIKKLNKKNDYYSCYNASLKYLSKCVRSEKEFKKFLEKFDLKSEQKNKIIQEFKDNGMLSNNRFVSSFIHDKFYFNNYGPFKIKTELQKHDIDDALIELELKKIDNNEIIETAKKIINKKIKLLKGSNYSVKQKLYLYMHNLGYEKEIVDLCFDEDIDDSKMLENEYNKIYIKLSNKNLEENEMYFKIKQKLYQKGYSLSKIDEIIEKKRS